MVLLAVSAWWSAAWPVVADDGRIRADPAREWLLYEAPPSCPSRDDLIAAVEQRVGALPERPLQSATIVVQPKDGAWLGSMVLILAEGRSEAQLVDPRCDVVVRAAAVKLAIAIVGERAASKPAPVEPSITAAPPVVEMEPPRSVPAIDPPRRIRWSGGVRGRVGVDAGTLPGVGPMYGLDVIARRRRLHLELGGVVLPNRRFRVDPDDRVGADAWSASGRAAICGAWRRRVLEATICGAGELGAVVVRGVGLARTHERTVVQAAVGPSARLAWVLRGLGIWLGADLDVALPRHSFAIPDLGVVHALAPVRSRVWIGLEARFPTHVRRPGRAP